MGSDNLKAHVVPVTGHDRLQFQPVKLPVRHRHRLSTQ